MIDVPNRKFSIAGSEAWRWCGWQFLDATVGYTRVLPLEYFGPIPN